VRVHAIGIGAPLADNAQRTGDGLDERALKLVAERTGGRYFRAETERQSQADLRGARSLRARRRATSVRYEERIELYAWPLGLAFALALAAFAAGVIPLRVRRA
jgi:Ca-activated chloride channel family protein